MMFATWLPTNGEVTSFLHAIPPRQVFVLTRTMLGGTMDTPRGEEGADVLNVSCVHVRTRREVRWSHVRRSKIVGVSRRDFIRAEETDEEKKEPVVVW